MKRIAAAFAIVGMILTGCKEVPPDIILTVPVPSFDTTYTITTMPALDIHNILIEDITGQGCSNCPQAHADIDSLVKQYPGRINAIGLYCFGVPQAVPPPLGKYDFRDSAASDILTSVFGATNSIPLGGIDRRSQNTTNPSSKYLSYDNEWSTNVSSFLGITDSINLQITSGYNSATGIDTIVVKTIFFSPDTSIKNLNIVMVEDSMIDWQEDGNALYNYDTFYHFNNVFRGVVTTRPYGDVIAPGKVKNPGTVNQHTYLYAVPKKVLNIRNCRLIAFVTYGSATGGKNVCQSVQIKVVQ